MDIARFYVVHKDYENLLVPDLLAQLYDFSNDFLSVNMDFEGKHYMFEDFCKKEPGETVRISNHRHFDLSTAFLFAIFIKNGQFQRCTNKLNVWIKHANNLFRQGDARNNPNLQLSYPVMYLFNRPKDIGNV